MIRDFSDSLIETYQNFIISDIILFEDIINIDLSSELDLDGDYPALTEEQKEATEYYLQPDSVQVILNELKNCSTIHFNDYYKVPKFFKKYNLNENDCLEIIKNLTVYDYYKSLRSTNQYHGGNNLIVFKPKITKLSNGKIFNNLVIYLKIDLDETTNEAIAVVSIHEDKEN